MKQIVFMYRQRTKKALQAGFTLVELMIATLIFSLILIIITAGVIHFTTDYYRGVNSSSTQNAAATATNNITQAFQFSSISGGFSQAAPSGGNPGSVCIGNLQFEYNLGNQQSSGTPSILEFTNGGTCYNSFTPPLALNPLYYQHAPGYGSRQELLQPNMRLTNLKINNPGGGSTWNITVQVAYGDNDLLCDSSLPSAGAGGCKSSALVITNAQIVTAGAANNLKCKVQSGSQFCDVSTLTTTVVQRVQ